MGNLDLMTIVNTCPTVIWKRTYEKLEYEFAQLQYECARISHLCIHKHKHLESNLEEAEADIQTLSDECNNLNNENESYSKKVRLNSRIYGPDEGHPPSHPNFKIEKTFRWWTELKSCSLQNENWAK